MTEPLGEYKPITRSGTHTLGPATEGHWCHTCRTDSALAADVLRLTDTGVETIAVLIHCPTCERKRTQPSA